MHIRLLRCGAIAALVALVAQPASGTGPLPSTKPEVVGLSQERLDRIRTMVKKHIDAGEISGAVMLVARRGQIAYLDVQGAMDVDSKKPMARDSVFRLASMTKPVIGVAVMMIQTPIRDMRPEFENAVMQGIIK